MEHVVTTCNDLSRPPGAHSLRCNFRACLPWELRSQASLIGGLPASHTLPPPPPPPAPAKGLRFWKCTNMFSSGGIHGGNQLYIFLQVTHFRNYKYGLRHMVVWYVWDMDTHTNTYTHKHTHARTHARTHAHTHTYRHTTLQLLQLYTPTHTHTHVCTHTNRHTHAHTHTYRHTTT